MDERTEEQKLYDQALRTEKRTIGHRMSRKVLVIAPDTQRAQDWAHSHGIAYSDAICVTPVNWVHRLHCAHGLEHVILGWSYFDEQTRDLIKGILVQIESTPFEGDSVDELCVADPERV